MIQITSTLWLDENEIQESFIRDSGPGGQNVNKVATAVQLRFDVTHSISLPDEVKKRLISLAGNRVTEDGILIINARRFRLQVRNREDALDRLTELIRRAATRPVVRCQTRPTLGSKMRRLDSKHHGAEKKRGRGSVNPGEE